MDEMPNNTPATFPAPPLEPQHTPNMVFFGRFGLRAGWGISIFLVLAAIIIFVAGFFAVASTGHLKEVIAAREQAKLHPGTPRVHVTIPFTATFVTINDGIGFFALLGVCWFFSKAERRRLSSYGIGANRRKDFIPGAIWGILSMSALVAVLRAMHLLVFDGRALHGFAIIRYGIAWLAAFVFVGFAEEYELRGYLQFTLMRGFWGLAERISPRNPHPVAFWIAATVTSCFFGFLHLGNGGENFLGILQVVLIGLVFCYALYRTGSLWWGIGFHALWDWMQSFTFGVADSGNISVGRLFVTHPTGKKLLSGGTDGPEGSILAVVAVLLTIAAIHLTTRPGIQPSPEQLPRHEESLPPESTTVIA